jgi:hypothetical protein
MSRLDHGQHELFQEFHRLVDASITRHVTSRGAGDVKRYLARLLIDFLRTDRIFALKDSEGRPVTSVAEMLAEGDVRLRAGSFEREREVHKHIGDFILFWQGVYPEFLRRLRLAEGPDLICDFPQQARASYRLVSQFDVPPHEEEARTCAKLSEGFDDFAFCLGDVARQLRAPPGAKAG